MNVHDLSLREALGQGRTLPAEWYTDANLFRREAERIFALSWNHVGRSAQVAEAGDFLTGRVGEVPVIIVRDLAGTLRAYANVCRHRGSELVLEKCGNRRTLQCHYHAWTWGLDGTLRAAPHCHEQPGFNKADFPLTPLNVESFGPFLFDIVVVESVQRGLRSGFYKQGQLILSRENGIQHFQKLVFSALTDREETTGSRP